MNFFHSNSAKDPSVYGIAIPSEAKALINRFNSNVSVKIVEANNFHAQAHLTKSPYIEFSTRVFEKTDEPFDQFTTEDIVVFVAHELGHIIPNSHFEISRKLFGVVFIITIIWFGYAPPIYPVTTLIILILWFNFQSRKEEYNADSFAIVEAGISTEIFTKAFIKADTIIRKENMRENRLRLFAKSLFKAVFATHPKLEQRITRVQTLYRPIKHENSPLI